MLRAIRNPKRLINSMSRDPDDTVVLVDHERQQIAVGACNFAIHEEILQLLVPLEPGGAKTIARPPISDGQPAPDTIAADERRVAVAGRCTRSGRKRNRFRRADGFN